MSDDRSTNADGKRILARADHTTPGEAARENVMAVVLGITELLENILECLAAPDLLRAGQVSHQWLSLVQCMIRTNILVRKKLFLTSATVYEVLDGSLEHGHDSPSYMRYVEPWKTDATRLEPKGAMLNPWLLRDCAADGGRIAGIPLSDIISHLRAGDMRGAMLLTQPPTSRITWGIFLGEKFAACEPVLSEHRTGQSLYIATRGSERSDGSLQGLADVLKFVERKVLQHWGCAVHWQRSDIHLGGDAVELQQLRDEVAGMVELDEQMWTLLETRPYAPSPPRAQMPHWCWVDGPRPRHSHGGTFVA